MNKIFRTGAVVPALIIIALIWAYFFFFFDLHAKHALEYVGTHANGAEVDIGRVRTSFWHASLEIDGIQVTDGTRPEKNKIQIGEMHWQMLWDALLRGKVAIEDASILNIAIGVTRAHPGYVLPPDPPSTKSAFTKLREQALDNAQKQFSQNIIGDAASILNGADPQAQLNSVKDNLKSLKRINELQTQLTQKESEWKTRIDKLPKQKDLDDLQARIKNVKLDIQHIPEIQKLVQDTQAQIANVNDTAKALNTDVNTYKDSLSNLDQMVKEDVKDVEGRLKLPSLDTKSLSKQVFGPLLLTKLKKYDYYYEKAREYMPPKKSASAPKENTDPKPHEREKGKNYAFGRPHAYPLFWLKHAALSSKANAKADLSGDLKGEIKNVTNDPPIIGVPTTAEFTGDFPAQELHGVDGKLTLDHTREDADDKVELSVKSFPVLGQKLVDTPDVALGFEKAVSAASFKAEMAGKQLTVAASSTFQRATPADIPQDPAAQPAPEPVTLDLKSANDLFGNSAQMAATKSTGFLEAKAASPALNDLLNGALSQIPKVTMNASVHGPWDSLDFDINSSLGQDLAAAFDKQIKAKVDAAKARIQALVNEQIGAQKAKLEAEFNKQKAQVDGILKQKQAELDKYKAQLDAEKDKAVKGQTNQLQDAAKKGLDQLKDKFHF